MRESPIPQESPKKKKVLLPPAVTIPRKKQPEAAVTATTPQNREDTPWPITMPTSTNLFNARASWPILPTEAPTVIKMEEAKKIPPRLAAILCTLVLNKPLSNKPAEDECRWGPQCPICTKSSSSQKTENTEDWNGGRQNNQQRNYHPQSPRYFPACDILDRFSQQLKL